jgi:uncharacterized membrane protein
MTMKPTLNSENDTVAAGGGLPAIDSAPESVGTAVPGDTAVAAEASRSSGALGALAVTAGRLAFWRWTGHKRWVAVLTTLFALFYSVFSCVMYYTYRVATYDLGIFDQGIRSYAHFGAGISIAKGLHNFGVADFSILGDHFSPIDILLAPLYWIYNSPVDLLIAQAVLFALAIPPIWAFTRREVGHGRTGVIAAYAVCIAYGLSWPIASATAFNFHEAAWAPMLMAIALERLQKGRLRGALIAMAFLLMVKEDMGLAVAAMGFGLVVTRRLGIHRQRLIGLAIAIFGLVYTFVAVWVFIPAMGGRANYYWAYQALGSNVRQAIEHIILHPRSSAMLLITPRIKLHTELELFAPFLFLALLSPIAWIALLLLSERMLANKFPNWWLNKYHYNSYLVVPIALASVQGAVRLQNWATWIVRTAWVRAVLSRVRLSDAASWLAGKIAVGFAIVFALFSIALVPHFPFGQMLHASFYHRNATATAEAAAASHVPSGVVVGAVNNIGPQLDTRDTVLIWDGGLGYGDTPWFTPWVIASVTQRQFAFYTLKEQVQRVALLRAHGYVTVFTDDGFIVLHAPGAAGANAVAFSNAFLRRLHG